MCRSGGILPGLLLGQAESYRPCVGPPAILGWGWKTIGIFVGELLGAGGVGRFRCVGVMDSPGNAQSLFRILVSAVTHFEGKVEIESC